MKKKGKKWLIYGHGGPAVLYNVLLAITTVLYVFLDICITINKTYEYQEHLQMGLRAALTLFWAFPTYLFFEVKHLIFKNQRVGEITNKSILFFGIQSLVGLIMQVGIIVVVADFYELQKGILLMSFLAAYGGCLGIMDLVSIPWPPLIWEYTLLMFKNKRIIMVCIGTTILLYVLSNVTYNIIQKVGF
jgi:hypothetical protein